NEHFNSHLKATRNTCSNAARRAPQEKQDYNPHSYGPEQGVVVNYVEISDCRLLGAYVIQVYQVMLYITRLWRNITSSHLNPYQLQKPVTHHSSMRANSNST